MQTAAKLNDLITPVLDEDEQIIVSCFALQGFTPATERWIRILGLYVIGSLLILILSDRVFVVLTNKRLIVVELTPKYLRVADTSYFPLELIQDIDVGQSGIYRIVSCTITTQYFRWRFPKSNLNFNHNGENALKLAVALKQLEADTSPEIQKLQAHAEGIMLHARSKMRKKSRGWFWTIVLGIPLSLLSMIGVAALAGTIVGDLENAPRTTVLIFSAITFIVTPVCVFILLRVVFGAFWSKEDEIFQQS